MNSGIEKKNQKIEALFVSSQKMLELVRAEDLDALESRMQERGALLDSIGAISSENFQIPDAILNRWFAILHLVRKNDGILSQSLEKKCRAIARRMVEIQDEKLELIESLDIDPRGHRIRAEA